MGCYRGPEEERNGDLRVGLCYPLYGLLLRPLRFPSS